MATETYSVVTNTVGDDAVTTTEDYYVTSHNNYANAQSVQDQKTISETGQTLENDNGEDCECERLPALMEHL